MLLSQSLLDQILKLANEAGKHLARFYQQDVKIQTKSDNTPVTEADLFVSQFLIEKLTALLLYKSLNPPKIQAFNTACQKQATDLKSDKRTL